MKSIHLQTPESSEVTITEGPEQLIRDEKPEPLYPMLYYMDRTRTNDTMKTLADDALPYTSTNMKTIEEKYILPRINSCAFFHKSTPGPGVPHGFVAFIRQWPSLPRLVVSLLN